MHRSIVAASARGQLTLTVSSSLRCSSELVPRVFTRALSRKTAPKATSVYELIDPDLRADRLKAAGEKAVQDKLERNAYNRQYREKRQKLFNAKKERKEGMSKQRVARMTRIAMDQPRRDAIKMAKEDWALGPLAPKRDYGEFAGTLGTIDMGLHVMPELSENMKAKVRARMGDNEFKPYDRVVVTRGRDRGKIGQILSINEDTMCASVEGVNKFAVKIPDYYKMYESDNRQYRIVRRDVPLDQIKCVYPIKNPLTGELREVILDRMELKKVLSPATGKTAKVEAGTAYLPTQDGAELERESEEAYELEDYEWKTQRFVPNTKIQILDFTESSKDVDENAEYGPNDTLLISVEEQTYFPEIHNSPMDMAAYKELKGNNFRTKAKFSERVEADIRERAEAKLRTQFEQEDVVRTPLHELRNQLHKLELDELKARKSGTDKSSSVAESDVLTVIGKAMAQKLAQRNPDTIGEHRRQLLQQIQRHEFTSASPATSVPGSSSRDAVGEARL